MYPHSFVQLDRTAEQSAPWEHHHINLQNLPRALSLLILCGSHESLVRTHQPVLHTPLHLCQRHYCFTRIAGASWTAQAAQHLSNHNQCLLVEPQPVRGLRQNHLCWLRTAFKNYPFGTVQNFFCAEQGPFGTST